MSDNTALETEVHLLRSEMHSLATSLALTAQQQETMQRDIASISSLMYEQKIKELQFEDTVRASFVRIELKLAKWTGMFIGGYAIAAAVWIIFTFVYK